MVKSLAKTGKTNDTRAVPSLAATDARASSRTLTQLPTSEGYLIVTVANPELSVTAEAVTVATALGVRELEITKVPY